MLTCSIRLLHDNIRAHTARAKQLLQSFNREVLDNPAQTPNLTASDFHLFSHLKRHLVSQKFHEDKEVKNKVIMWLHVQAAEFYDIRI
jgi:recombinational DNA repair protein (RecF pathway)